MSVEAAGVLISPAAAQAVAEAPASSCLGNPTMIGCPTVTSIVSDGVSTGSKSGAFGTTDFSTATPDAAGQCKVTASAPATGGSPKKISGTAKTTCPAGYSYWEVTGELQANEGGTWEYSSEGETDLTSSGIASSTATSVCAGNQEFSWRTHALAYSVNNAGQGFTDGLVYGYANRDCHF